MASATAKQPILPASFTRFMLSAFWASPMIRPTISPPAIPSAIQKYKLESVKLGENTRMYRTTLATSPIVDGAKIAQKGGQWCMIFMRSVPFVC